MQLAKHAFKASKVIAIAGSDEKCEWLKKIGADIALYALHFLLSVLLIFFIAGIINPPLSLPPLSTQRSPPTLTVSLIMSAAPPSMRAFL